MEKDGFGTYTLVLKSKEMTQTDVNHFSSKYGSISKLHPTSQNKYYISYSEKAVAENALKILKMAGKNKRVSNRREHVEKSNSDIIQ